MKRKGQAWTEEEVRAILESWMENPFWREYYEMSPSEKCRELITLEFMYSEEQSEEILQGMRCVEEELELEDWQYLYRYCGNNPRKKKIHDRIVELGGE